MALADARTGSGEPPKVSLLYNPALRSVVYQVVTFVVIVAAVWYAWHNVIQNLARANMSAGFGFLNSRAGFDIAQTLIAYSSDSTYFRALQVGLINTLVIAVDSDRLFLPRESERIAAAVPGAGPVRYLRSPYGHDGFLIKHEQVTRHLGGFLRQVARS